MTQGQLLRRLKRSHWKSLERVVTYAYQKGIEEGRNRAHGGTRRGRTVRGDATVEGLVRLIERHFGLRRYGFEVRIVHPRSGRRIPARDLLLHHLAME